MDKLDRMKTEAAIMRHQARIAELEVTREERLREIGNIEKNIEQQKELVKEIQSKIGGA